MTAAERKVRERYPDATGVEYRALDVAHVWATTQYGREIIGRGETLNQAWSAAESRVAAEPVATEGTVKTAHDPRGAR